MDSCDGFGVQLVVASKTVLPMTMNCVPTILKNSKNIC